MGDGHGRVHRRHARSRGIEISDVFLLVLSKDLCRKSHYPHFEREHAIKPSKPIQLVIEKNHDNDKINGWEGNYAPWFALPLRDHHVYGLKLYKKLQLTLYYFHYHYHYHLPLT